MNQMLFRENLIQLLMLMIETSEEKKKVEKSILMNYKYALAKYMIWKYYAKAPNIITF